MSLLNSMKEKQIKREKENNPFGDRNYQMQEEYLADEILVGKFTRVANDYDSLSPRVEKTNQKYFFVPIVSQDRMHYRELFTGFITDVRDNTTKFSVFNFPYVCEVEKFTDYFPNMKGFSIPKLSLLWTLNDINDPKKMQQKNQNHPKKNIKK